MLQMKPLEKSTKFFAGGLVGLVVTILLFFVFIPRYVEREVLKQKGLGRGSFSREMWEKFPEPLNFNVYIFNVTNPGAVTLGAQPIVKEIGPFAYDEYKWKAEFRDRESDDTVAYRPETWWYFNQTRSKSLTGNEMVTVPNPILLGIVTMIERDMSGILGMINAAVKEIFRDPKSVFMTVTVRQLMFDGVAVNCSVKELGTKAVCAALGVMKSSELKKTGKDMYTFSFLGGRNGTHGDWVRVVRGTRDNGHDVGKLVEFKRKSKLSAWAGRCSQLIGTDGTVFPPLLAETTRMYIFAQDICRSLPLQFVRAADLRGVPVFRYTADLGDIANDEDYACFCRSNSTCPKKGTMDLTRCTGTPVVVSLPHFYLAASQYQAGVVGLNPVRKKHEIIAELEPLTGTPLLAVSRLQFNIELHKVSRVAVMRKLQTTMHPILWVEEGITIPQKYLDRLDSDLLSTLRTIKIISWLLIILFVGLTVYGIYLHRKHDQVAPVATSPQKSISIIETRERHQFLHMTPEKNDEEMEKSFGFHGASENNMGSYEAKEESIGRHEATEKSIGRHEATEESIGRHERSENNMGSYEAKEESMGFHVVPKQSTREDNKVVKDATAHVIPEIETLVSGKNVSNAPKQLMSGNDNVGFRAVSAPDMNATNCAMPNKNAPEKEATSLRNTSSGNTAFHKNPGDNMEFQTGPKKTTPFKVMFGNNVLQENNTGFDGNDMECRATPGTSMRFQDTSETKKNMIVLEDCDKNWGFKLTPENSVGFHATDEDKEVFGERLWRD